MTSCSHVQSQFSDYLDGAIPGAEMQSVAAHLDSCADCSGQFASWRGLQTLLANARPPRPPADLGLRLRVAISQERARTARRRLDIWQLYWQNSMGPFLARGAAGLASALVLLAALGLMIGTVAAPPSVAANETAAESTSTPHFLYTVGAADSKVTFRTPVVLAAQVSKEGRVYGYRILSGPDTPEVHEQLDNFLLMSHFTPAQFYGIPVPSQAILSISGLARGRG